MSVLRASMAALAAAVALLGVAAAQVAPAAAPAGERAIVRVAGDVYRATDGVRTTVYGVTPQGIVLADPLDVAFSQWLKGELAARHPNRPVRFVLHTSHAADRAAGGAVWAADAEVLAQETFTSQVKKAAAAAPDAYRDVRAPESTFSDRRRITLGGRTIDAIAAPTPQAPEAVVVLFVEERVLFVADATMRHDPSLRADIVVAGRASAR